MVIDNTASLLVVMGLLVLAISVFAVINRISVLNTMSNEMARYIEVHGNYGSAAAAELARLQSANGMNATMSFNGELSGGKIPLGSPFTVKLKARAYIGIGSLMRMPIPISASSTGRGEKLWK